MTSNNSSIKEARQKDIKQTAAQEYGKRNSFLTHSTRSYWWLAVICAVVYGFAGPVFTLLRLDSIQRPSQANYLASETEELFYQQHLERVADWFSGDAFIPLYLCAVVLAAVAGCVVFFYLQQKRQVNFYHSQPISRTRLFMNQYIAGLLVNIIPLLLMLAITCLIVMAYGLGAALSVPGILQHGAYMVLLALASYSIAVLAGQLAGTMMTQMALNAVLHFAVPVAAVVVTMMQKVFFATHTDTMDLMDSSLKFSPLCAAADYLGSIRYTVTDIMVVTPMAGSMMAVQILLIAICSGLAWFLYQKRPSEATGKALVYPVTEPLLKAFLMFVVSLLAGFVFLSVGNKFFFYFAVVAFAVLTHMTCEVIIQHDFKAMVRRMPQCAVIVVLILTVIGVFRFDLLGYDNYLPAPEKVAKVTLMVDEAEPGYWSDISNNYSQDTTVKQLVYDLLEPVVAEKQFNSNSFTNHEGFVDNGNRSSTVRVQYELTNGKFVERQYRNVPGVILAENYEELYNQAAYRDGRYRYVTQILPEWIENMAVDDTHIFTKTGDGERVLTERAGVTTATTVAAEKLEKPLSNEEEFARAARILKAYQQDLHDRSFATLTQIHQHTISISVPREKLNGGYSNYMDLPVFAGDKRTMAVLNELGIQAGEEYTGYQQAYIFSCKDAKELQKFYHEQWELANVDGRQMDVDAHLKLFADKAQLVTTIDGAKEVNAFIQQTRLKTYGGMFVAYDDTHFVLLRGKNEDSETGENWEFQRVYADTLPEQYQ